MSETKYTIVLSTRYYSHLGQIHGIDYDTINISNNLNSANEISFSVYKTDLSKECSFLSDEEYRRYKAIIEYIWDNIVDFKLIWVRERNEYFSITVSTDDSSSTVKTVVGTSLCESELSSYLIDSLEVNTADDPMLSILYQEDDEDESTVDADASTITVFYNEEKPHLSFLNRVLADKAPHYNIVHVDDSLRNLVREFSVSDTDIYSFLVGEVSEQFNCLFQFNSSKREISVYDLYTVCQNSDCDYLKDEGEHYRDDYDMFLTDDSNIPRCPKCGSTNVKYFGEDTTILVDKRNLTDSINLSTNADNVKNCLKLVGGDDLITAAIQMLNPNGTSYLYHFSEFQKNDMPKTLVQAINDYDALYNSKISGYQDLVQKNYDVIDRKFYLESSMMPTIKQSEVTAQTEATKINERFSGESPDVVSLQSVSNVTATQTVESALKAYLPIFVKTGYVKISVDDDSKFEYKGTNDDGDSYGIWTGILTLTSYADKSDTCQTNKLTITVTDNHQKVVDQTVSKELNDADKEGDIFDVLSITRDDKDEELAVFTDALKAYCETRLSSFQSAIEGALNALNEMGIGSDTTTDDYKNFYLPYLNKKGACEEALNAICTGAYSNGEKYKYTYNDKEYVGEGINSLAEEMENTTADIETIQSTLNFKDYLVNYNEDGESLYNTYCAYRREDIYSNENYVSTGIEDDNAAILRKAEEFLEVAKREIRKASEPEFTISSSLKNLLVIDEFEPIRNGFKLGNWIRVRIDGQLYRLRLINYSINQGSPQDISVEFSSVTKEHGVMHDAQQLISSAKTISTNFGYVKKQAKRGSEAQSNISQWKQDGLNSGLVKIQNNDKEEVIYDRNGILCRSYDDITGTYSQEQLKLTHNILAFTNDGWQSVRQLIGNHEYLKYNELTNKWEWNTGYGNTSDFVVSGHVTGSTIVGGIIMSENFCINKDGDVDFEKDRYNCTGTFIDLKDGCFSFGGKLTYDEESGLRLDNVVIADAVKSVDVTAENLKIPAENINGEIEPSQINTTDLKVKADNIEGKISSEKVDFSGLKISSSQLSDFVPSDKIAETLKNKTLETSLLSGTVKTSNESGEYTGITKDVTIGSTVLKFVNGLLVGVTETSSS